MNKDLSSMLFTVVKYLNVPVMDVHMKYHEYREYVQRYNDLASARELSYTALKHTFDHYEMKLLSGLEKPDQMGFHPVTEYDHDWKDYFK